MGRHFGMLVRSMAAATVLLLGGCVTPLDTATRSPPRVDVPEPGGERVGVRPGAATSSARPGAAAVPNGSAGYPSAGAATTYPAGEARVPEVEAPGQPSGQPAGEDGFTVEMPGSADEAAAPPQSGNRAVSILLAQADDARRGGNLDAAIAAAERALRIAPSDPAAYCQLAELRLERGEPAQAEQLARKGLSHGPDALLRARLEAVLQRSRR